MLSGLATSATAPTGVAKITASALRSPVLARGMTAHRYTQSIMNK